jgi:transcriptional regulator with XRE-family HTH domain
MINNKEKILPLLKQFGQRLKEARLARNESQEVFAVRIGVTRQSYSKMEKGAASVPIGNWLAASEILGRLNTWRDVLLEKENFFEQFEKKQKQQVRKRASGKRSKVND